MKHIHCAAIGELRDFLGLQLNRLTIICLIFATGLVLAMKPVAAAPATFTPLGLFGGSRSRGHDISADGSVVVGTRGTFQLFHWTAQDTRFGPDTRDSAAVSADGTVVVSTIATLPSPRGTSVRWAPGKSQDLIGNLPGDTDSGAADASADGAVIVGSSNVLFAGPPASNPEAYRWTEATGMVGLGGLPGAEIWSSASGVSPDGAVVVGLVLDSNNSGQAFRWTAATGMVVLPRPANATFAAANGISADGSVIIGRVDIGPPNPGPPIESQDVAFRWTSATGMVGLGDLPGGNVASEAFDVSADGSVIVGVGETAADNEAFYWTTTAGMRSLRDVLVSFGATNLDGWLLTEARGVSADGSTVVGTAISPAGVQQAFVATIPEPSSVVLVAVAAAALVVVARRKTWQSRAIRKQSQISAT